MQIEVVGHMLSVPLTRGRGRAMIDPDSIESLTPHGREHGVTCVRVAGVSYTIFVDMEYGCLADAVRAALEDDDERDDDR
jgi:hypothetical protein